MCPDSKRGCLAFSGVSIVGLWYFGRLCAAKSLLKERRYWYYCISPHNVGCDSTILGIFVLLFREIYFHEIVLECPKQNYYLVVS